MLAFVPIGQTLVPIPGSPEVENQSPRRLCARVREGKWVILSEPHKCSPESREAINLSRMAARGDIAPADAETARACGVEFRPVEHVNGFWKFAPAKRVKE